MIGFFLTACGAGDDDDTGGGGKATVSNGSGGQSNAGKGGASGKNTAGEGGGGGKDAAGSGGKGDAGASGSGGGVTGGGTGGTSGSGGGGSGGAPARMIDEVANAVTPGKICTRQAEIMCAAEQDCCPNPGRDAAACEAAQAKSCTDDLMADAIADRSEAGFDAAQAKKVFNALEQMAIDCDPALVEFSESAEGLLSMFKGTLNAGADCSPDDPLDMAQSGAALVSCKDHATYACLPDVLGWTCAERKGVGATCYTDLNCTQGIFCENPDLDVRGDDCDARKDDGANCELFNECKSLYCHGGKCAPPDASSFCIVE